MKTKKIELLAPGGDIDAIKAAILAGADAVYCGLEKFSARDRAKNVTLEQLRGIVGVAHKNDCQIFITINIMVVETEFPTLVGLLNKLANTQIDGLIVQDLGVLYLLSKLFGSFPVHASTQLTTHNDGQIRFLHSLSVSRVNLSRELNIFEIKALTDTAHRNAMSTEVFVHGSNCISFSGLCYMSSVLGGNSGNRGRCSQPCRDKYEETPKSKHFPFNLKDNSAFFNLKEISNAGVDAIKIEGRIKKFHYVYTVVNAWRKQLHQLYNQNSLSEDATELYTVYNRDFSNAFLVANINKSMFIDNPKDNSGKHLLALSGATTEESVKQANKKLYEDKTKILTAIRSRIAKLSIEKKPLSLHVSGELGIPLNVSVKSPDSSFSVCSQANLVASTKERSMDNIGGIMEGEIIDAEQSSLCSPVVKEFSKYFNFDMLFNRFKALNETEYYIADIDLSHLCGDLYLPAKEIDQLKNEILFILHNSKKRIEPVAVPVFPADTLDVKSPTLSVLISSRNDVDICSDTPAQVYFQLPSVLKNHCTDLIAFFKDNKNLAPWFPPVLIGDDFAAAIEFLDAVMPNLVVTNNSGIAYEAHGRGIAWIAGPYLNTANSFSMHCLKEQFGCSGAFVSNEISKLQIKRISKPADFSLHYSIYHPITLLTSRQCLFHQITGCEKDRVDDACMAQCNKNASIKNLKNVTFFVDKTKNNYHCIYNEHNFLNTEIITDIPHLFSSFLIDMREIKTATQIKTDRQNIVSLFEKVLTGNLNSARALQRHIHPVTNIQYTRGV